MTALERIKKIDLAPKLQLRRYYDENLKGNPQLMLDDIYYLLKAFQVMREIALEIDLEQFESGEDEKELDEEFERRMKDENASPSYRFVK